MLWVIFPFRFNLLRFAETTESWKESLVEATDESCHDAVQWASTCHAHGNSCILAALQVGVAQLGEHILSWGGKTLPLTGDIPGKL